MQPSTGIAKMLVAGEKETGLKRLDLCVSGPQAGSTMRTTSQGEAVILRGGRKEQSREQREQEHGGQIQVGGGGAMHLSRQGQLGKGTTTL